MLARSVIGLETPELAMEELIERAVVSARAIG
jgi:hypothetical protein